MNTTNPGWDAVKDVYTSLARMQDRFLDDACKSIIAAGVSAHEMELRSWSGETRRVIRARGLDMFEVRIEPDDDPSAMLMWVRGKWLAWPPPSLPSGG